MKDAITRFLADRVSGTGSSERTKMLEYAAKYTGTVNLGRGDPDLPTPANIVKAGQQALAEGATHYSHWAGVPQLRQAIARYLQDFDQVTYDPAAEIIVTNGAQEAIVVAMLGLINDGDEVLVPEPRYTPYDFSIALAGGKLVPVHTCAEDKWAVTTRELIKVVSPRSKVLLLINPNNPTGALMNSEELQSVADFAKEHDLVVISDELYSGLLFDGAQWKSIASLPDMRERTIIINGFSKTFSMTGWRLGYLSGPAELVQPMLEVHYSLTICAPAMSQAAGIEALNGDVATLNKSLPLYDARRKLAMERLSSTGLPFVKPMGTFYIFPDVRKYGMKSFDFCVRLLEQANVLVFPGTVFGASGEGYVRMSLLRPYEELEEGFRRMAGTLQTWQARS